MLVKSGRETVVENGYTSHAVRRREVAGKGKQSVVVVERGDPAYAGCTSDPKGGVTAKRRNRPTGYVTVEKDNCRAYPAPLRARKKTKANDHETTSATPH